MWESVAGHQSVQRHRRHGWGARSRGGARGARSRVKEVPAGTGREPLGEERGERGYAGAQRRDTGDAEVAERASQVPVHVETVDEGGSCVRVQRRHERLALRAALLRRALFPRSHTEALPLEALPSSKETPIFKHICRHGVQGPVIALPGVSGFSWHFYKAVI